MNHNLAAGILLSLTLAVSACSLTDTSSLGAGGSGGTGAADAGAGSAAGGSAAGGSAGAGASGATSAVEIGARCTVSEQCASGVCADGVCCQTACAGGCEACSAAAKGSGVDGECGPVAKGTDPRGNCSDQGPESCGDTGACDGAGACSKYPANTLCTASSCEAGLRTLPRQCDGSGTCVDAGTQACGDDGCSGRVCFGQCEDDAGCLGTEFCDAVSGSCTPKRPNGTLCQSNLANQCQSGICADGVCCNSACAGTCEGCATGTCTPHPAGSDLESDCDPDPAQSCAADGMCDGSGGCRKWVAGTPCGTESCSGSSYTPAAQCDGSGACTSLGSVGCAPYVCAGNRCAESCASSADCASGVPCDSATHTCKSPLPGGAACNAADQCQSGYCADGRCCNTPCEGECEACSAAKRGVGLDGECGPIAAGTDPDEECLKEDVATCGLTGLCSGSASCASYASDTVCQPASCVLKSVLQPASNCLSGTCSESRSISCSPYLCVGSACAGGCLTDSECVSTHYCDLSGSCKPKGTNGAKCSRKGGTECISGICAGGYCCSTSCTGTCQTCGVGGMAPAGTCSGVRCGGPDTYGCIGNKHCVNGACSTNLCELPIE